MTQEQSEFDWIFIQENKTLPPDVNLKAPFSKPSIPLTPSTPDQTRLFFAQRLKILSFVLWALLMYVLFFGRGSKPLVAFDQLSVANPPVSDEPRIVLVPEIVAFQQDLRNQGVFNKVTCDLSELGSSNVSGKVGDETKEVVIIQDLNHVAAIVDFFIDVGVFVKVAGDILKEFILEQIEVFRLYYQSMKESLAKFRPETCAWFCDFA
ncbi:hypothetical protein HK096_001200 [Nowakowskiella sp. JEL0078]|nr:hypothetical protein HK096_001200 [Nowakowskiella sp. JEL0078]